jgi:hypothetical protein
MKFKTHAHRIAACLVFLILGQVAHIAATIRMLWAIMTNSEQALIIALGWDRLGNAATNGESEETISSRSARARNDKKQWGCVMCKFLNWMFREMDHCTRALLYEYTNTHAQRILKNQQHVYTAPLQSIAPAEKQ